MPAKKSSTTREVPLDAADVQGLQVHEILPAERVFESSRFDIEARKINELIELIYTPEGISQQDLDARIVRAIELFNSLKPADGEESMLAMQMVGTHSAAMECLKRAKECDTIPQVDVNLKYAHKLMSLYTKQLETLNKHRGKGQQKVTVEHVNVAPGGQAIVGNVSTDGNGKQNQQDKPVAAIDHTDEMPMETIRSSERVKSGKAQE